MKKGHFLIALLSAALAFMPVFAPELAHAQATPAPAAAGAGGTNMSGTWQLTVDSPMGKRTPSVLLQQQGNALSGTYTGQFGSAPVTGSVNGTTFKFSFTISAMMREVQITYEGKVTGSSIGGDIHAAGMGDGKFTGTKK